jgi:hypothetical protein
MNIMSHQCPNCDYTTTRNANMQRHINTKHSVVKQDTCACDICKKEFVNKYSRDRHYKQCVEFTKSGEVIIFDSKKIFIFPANFLKTNLEKHFTGSDDRTYVLARYLLSKHYSIPQNRNVYIVKDYCYTFLDGKGWTRTEENPALIDTCTTFIKYSLLKLKGYYQCGNSDVNRAVEDWTRSFGGLYICPSNPKFIRMYEVLRSVIKEYSIVKFPKGYFKKFKTIPLENKNSTLKNAIEQAEYHEKKVFFGFCGDD